LLAELDKNGSRDVDQRELAGIVEARPDIVLNVGLPPLSSRGESPTLELVKLSDDLAAAARADASPGRVTITLDGYHLDLFVINGAAPDRTEVATALFARLDADKNESLEKGELDELLKASGLAIEAVDRDKDGKVVLDEIKKATESTPVYRDAQVRVRAGEAGDPLFGWLDADNDGRLTRRELELADKRLAELDADGDGYTSAAEIPGRLACAIGRPTAAQEVATPTARATARRAGSSDAPKWMTAMDTNADGEISHREFLGTGEQFVKLDANQDGFIDAAEAARAGSAADAVSNSEQATNPSQ
jgi:Ca2+-binding EF-hand superfamily protein